MEKKVKVQASYLTKNYEMAPSRAAKIKSLLLKRRFPHFWALRGVDFKAYEGESIAIIGTNGSGKSTLMNIISNIIPAATGTFEVDGAVSLIAVRSGLRGSLTGRDNIRLKGLMMGMTRDQIDAKMQSIIDFSELGPFIDQPVKDYSSGMRSKLGFSISVHADPDILIVDEALSVGDATFTRKSLDKIKAFQQMGKTIFFVSHSLSQVQEMADRVIWLERGQIKMFDTTEKVLAKYDEFVRAAKKANLVQRRDQQIDGRFEQENFNLDKLYAKEAATAGKNADYEQIYADTHRLNKPKAMSTLEKFGLLLAALVLIVIGDVTILDQSPKAILKNPSILVTSWTPAGIKRLDQAHQNFTMTGVQIERYRVKKGDTLQTVAKHYNVKPEQIVRESKLTSEKLKPNQVLKIPKKGEK